MQNIEVERKESFEKLYGRPPEVFMDLAHAEMRIAVEKNCPPFTVVVVHPTLGIIHVDHDKTEYEGTFDPSAHAEINATRVLCEKFKSKKLPSGIAYVTSSEPCPPCFFVMQRAGVSTIVFGARTETNKLDPPMHIEEMLSRTPGYRPLVLADIMSDKMTKVRNQLTQQMSRDSR